MLWVPNLTVPGRAPSIPLLTPFVELSDTSASRIRRLVPARGVALKVIEPAAAVACA